MEKVIDFPVPKKQPVIDWDLVETERRSRYPKVPKKAISIIRKILESGPGDEDSSIILDKPEECFPKDPIHYRTRTSDVFWLMDLLDRFGGDMVHGKHTCRIKRSKKILPLFSIFPVNDATMEAVRKSFGPLYEHYMESKEWQILGRDLSETDVIAFLLEGLNGNGRKLFGVLDRKTAWVHFSRLEEGFSVEDFIELGL
ncbi:MAG: hypothetical protein ABFD98_05965 [Syntrophobacteraceae bacterium]